MENFTRFHSTADVAAGRRSVIELMHKLDSYQEKLPPNTVRRCRDAPGMNAYVETHSAILQRLVEVRQFLKSKDQSTEQEDRAIIGLTADRCNLEKEILRTPVNRVPRVTERAMNKLRLLDRAIDTVDTLQKREQQALHMGDSLIAAEQIAKIEQQTLSQSKIKYKSDEDLTGTVLLLCPLSKAVFRDPVILADGLTYERTNAEAYVSTHDSSPVTGRPLAHKRLVPNVLIRQIVTLMQCTT